MGINISAVGYGGGALSIAGAVLLAAIGNSSWSIFLMVGVLLVIFGELVKKI